MLVGGSGLHERSPSRPAGDRAACPAALRADGSTPARPPQAAARRRAQEYAHSVRRCPLDGPVTRMECRMGRPLSTLDGPTERLPRGPRHGTTGATSGRPCRSAGGIADEELRIGRPGRQSVRRAAAEGGRIVPIARTLALGLPDGCGPGSAPGLRAAIAAPGAAGGPKRFGRLNAYAA